MLDHTTTTAAAYLTAHGYTVFSRRNRTHGPPTSELIKRWCERGKLPARKTNWAWLIPQAALDALIAAQTGGTEGE
jgi:hypothetical protein